MLWLCQSDENMWKLGGGWNETCTNMIIQSQASCAVISYFAMFTIHRIMIFRIKNWWKSGRKLLAGPVGLQSHWTCWPVLEKEFLSQSLTKIPQQFSKSAPYNNGQLDVMAMEKRLCQVPQDRELGKTIISVTSFIFLQNDTNIITQHEWSNEMSAWHRLL